MKKTFLSLALVGLLAACGGGGRSSDITPESVNSVSVTRDGFYSGVSSTGYNTQVLVDTNDRVWAIYGSPNNIYGVVVGNPGFSTSTFNGNFSDFNFQTGTRQNATLDGTYQPKSSITFTGPVSGSFSYELSYNEVLKFNNPVTLTGWALMWGVGNRNITISISPRGNGEADISGLTSDGCRFTGNTTLGRGAAQPVNVTFGQGCLISGQTLPGAIAKTSAGYYIMLKNNTETGIILSFVR